LKNTSIEPSTAEYKALDGQVAVDEARGIVECFVAAIGNKDSVGDVVLPGAFNGSLKRRKPRVVWGHNWNEPIGKVLEIYEVPPNDPRLPSKMRSGGVGGLFAKVQFNLKSERGREAFANVVFFGAEQEWSIGYKTLDAVFDPAQSANLLKEVELYEVSPVLHGANQLTGTISIKSDKQNTELKAENGPCWPGYKQVGMKKGKGGKMVPNCVPIKGKSLEDDCCPEEKAADKPVLRDPKGGLTAAGRAHFKRKEGANLKPGVKGAADTPQKMRRKGSFLTRFFTNPRGPMKDAKGRPTRLALSAAAWGEPVPQDRSDAAKLAAKGRRLLDRYEHTKKKSDEAETETKNHIGDVYAANVVLARPQDTARLALTEAVARHFGGPCRIMYADQNMIVAEMRRDGVNTTLRIPYHSQGSEYMFGTSEEVKPQVVYVPTDTNRPAHAFGWGGSPEKNNDGGCGCDSCGKPMPSWNVFKDNNPGKHLFVHSADDIGLMGAINAADEKGLDVELLDVGLAIKNIDELDDDSYDNLIELIDDFEEKKLGATLRGASRARFDPDARDADSDFIVQEGTIFERPHVPKRNKPKPARMMPAVPNPEKQPVPEKVPQPIPAPTPVKPPVRPPVPAPAEPVKPPIKVPVPVGRGITGAMGAVKPGRSPREIFESRMGGETLDQAAARLKMNRKRVRQMEQQYINQLRKREALAEKLREALLERDGPNNPGGRGLDDESAAMFWQSEDALRGEWTPSADYSHDDMVKAMRWQAEVMSRDYKDEEAANLFRQAADLHDQVVSEGSYKTFRDVDPEINRRRGVRRNIPKRNMPELDAFRKK